MSIAKWRRLLVAGVLVVGVTTGCTAPPADYNERMKYLEKIAGQGVEMHDLIESQDGEPTEKRCKEAFEGVSDYVDNAPNDDLTEVDNRSKEWEEQIKAFFVDSCVSGVPRKPDEDKPDPSGSSSPSKDDESSKGAK